MTAAAVGYSLETEQQIADAVAETRDNPYEFVRLAYDWPLNGEPGPDAFQTQFLKDLGGHVRQRDYNGTDAVLPVRMGTSSGHGIGKSALVAWIVDWIMSTRPYCRGTITANTNDQLELKTWAAVREWTGRLINAHWFEVHSRKMYRKGHQDRWFCAPASCAEENSEAFAGQHAAGSTSFYLFDEASAIPDKIWEVAEGGLVRDEPMIFAFGNPTRNTGQFYRLAFGDKRERWDIRIVDARDSKFSNKTLIAEWAQDYGEDSDFFRVRVRGLAPNADELQFIGADRVAQAQRNVVHVLADEPLVMGVDVSGGGAAMTVCAFRRGFDARTIPPIVLTGAETNAHDRQLAISRLAQAIEDHAPQAVFIDAAYGAVLVARLNDLGYHMVHEVNFGGASPDRYCENLRAFMWNSVREWLPRGAIDPRDAKLATDLTGPGFARNKRNRLVLESKASMQARGVASPDRGDALALTFAMPVHVPQIRKQAPERPLSQHPASWLGA